jgi:cbb3-type cytochrome oxidase maturation protein
MSVIFVLIPLAVIIIAIAIGIFFWAVKSNQFDDLERQGHSILFDDDIETPKTIDTIQNTEQTNKLDTKATKATKATKP